MCSLERISSRIWLIAPSIGGWNFVPHGVGRVHILGVVERVGRAVVEAVALPPQLERRVGEDVGAGLGSQPGGAAEVVGMAVRDDHRVDARSGMPARRRRSTRPAHASGPGSPGSTTAKPRSSSSA